MKILKYLINWNYHFLVNWTNKFEREVINGRYDLAKVTDGIIINKFNYGIDREEWIRLTRIRMKFHYKVGNVTQAWQLGNNLLYMMGDNDPDTIALHAEITECKNKMT